MNNNQRSSMQLCEFFLAIARNEKKIEVIRQLLAENEDFEPYAVFKRIDRENKQFITAEDIIKFLSDNNCPNSIEQCITNFIQKYDLDNDSKLNFQE